MRPILTIALSLVAGFAGAGLWQASGLGDAGVRRAIMAEPAIIPDAIEEWQKRETQSEVAKNRAELETPWPGAVLGNPNGSVTLVEFSDYACGYCRQSVAEVDALIAANPDLRVVIREFPIFGEASQDAARMALAAADQGKFEAFHRAMFETGDTSTAGIEAAARKAGLDLERARADVASGKYDAHLGQNAKLAQALRLSGTPAWTAGDRLVNGYVPASTLQAALAEAEAAAR